MGRFVPPHRFRGPLTRSVSRTLQLLRFVSSFFDADISPCSLGNYTSWTTYVGSCENWNDSTDWSAGTIQGFQDFALASMDALQNYFFWTWKIGNSTNFSYDVNPMWHYRLGLERGWAPKDPRSAEGHCAGLGVNNAFTGTLDAWNTGGVSLVFIRVGRGGGERPRKSETLLSRRVLDSR